MVNTLRHRLTAISLKDIIFYYYIIIITIVTISLACRCMSTTTHLLLYYLNLISHPIEQIGTIINDAFDAPELANRTIQLIVIDCVDRLKATKYNMYVCLICNRYFVLTSSLNIYKLIRPESS